MSTMSHWDNPKADSAMSMVEKITSATRVMNAMAAVVSLALFAFALGCVFVSWARGKVAARTATRREGAGASASVN